MKRRKYPEPIVHVTVHIGARHIDGKRMSDEDLAVVQETIETAVYSVGLLEQHYDREGFIVVVEADNE
jgi:hypothetical protein